MADLELVEKLRERARVTYDEAKEALDACEDDLLDAVIYLERRGKVPPPAGGGSFTSQREPGGGSYTAYKAKPQKNAESLSDLLRRFANWLGKMLNKSFIYTFVVKKNETAVFTVPVIVLLLLLLCAFWVTIPLLIIGLFFDLRYSFHGPESEKTQEGPIWRDTSADSPRRTEKPESGTEEKINAIIDDVARAADELKAELKINMENIGKDKDRGGNGNSMN